MGALIPSLREPVNIVQEHLILLPEIQSQDLTRHEIVVSDGTPEAKQCPGSAHFLSERKP
jgi:hypothetical protein